ncbi:MAG TPA: hypothetical protein VFX54_04305, partial [Candidatus Binatia bacterium]|nr:hypothetical protein [Candidatus Binatia bacterium]
LAPRNATVVAVLFLCAVSVAGSIFTILEMDQPFEGLMKISSAPLRYFPNSGSRLSMQTGKGNYPRMHILSVNRDAGTRYG